MVMVAASSVCSPLGLATFGFATFHLGAAGPIESLRGLPGYLDSIIPSQLKLDKAARDPGGYQIPWHPTSVFYSFIIFVPE